MDFNADIYFAAAQERLADARELYRTRHYGLTHYISGVAVECVLRAYRFRRNPEFESRHDLYNLYHGSVLKAVLNIDETYKTYAALLAVHSRWANDFRYRSDAALRRHLKRIGADRGIKGDFLKENARRIVEAAAEVVKIGGRAWKRS
jgi:HEPN domain-containing protein